ncbi:MAG: Hpt domain-containing protein, partial [Chthonomonadales bacterium]
AERQDAAAVAEAAHGVKGASGTVGGRRLAELCHQLEVEGYAGSVASVNHLLPEIESEFQYLCDALAQVAQEDK